MTEDEIASKAETLDSKHAYTGFQHFWNIVATTGGGGSLKSLAHHAFLAGVATGEARSAVRNNVPLPTGKPSAETSEELAKHRTNHVFNDQP